MKPWEKAGVVLGALGGLGGIIGFAPWTTPTDVQAAVEKHVDEERTERRDEAKRIEGRVDEVGRDVKRILEILAQGRH